MPKPQANPRHVLVVDDDRRIRELLKSYLVENGFLVTSAASAAEARARLRGMMFDIIVLDVMMPGENGLELVTALRSAELQVPVLMLSALADPQDRIAGLMQGSDDYLVKPFEPKELLLRINNLLRRADGSSSASPDTINFGDFQFTLSRGELRRNGDILRLTSGEKELLRQLARRPGQPLSRLELVPAGAEEQTRSVDVQITRLRQKIERDPANPQYLQTVRGFGYTLIADKGNRL